MGVYIPLRVRLTPASIPQVVAYIQTYLRDNPIPSIDTFADLIASFLSDHPELVAVASVNGKTGAVILTGADIMLNGDSALTLETEITNLNSMIAELSRQVAEAVATVENAQEDIDDLGSQISELEQTLTTIENSITQINNTITSDETLISANTTKNAQQDTRLQALENSIDGAEEDIDDLQTLTTLHTEQIESLNETIGDASEVLERIGEVEQDVSNLESSVSAIQTSVGSLQTRMTQAESSIGTLNTNIGTVQTNISEIQSKANRVLDCELILSAASVPSTGTTLNLSKSVTNYKMCLIDLYITAEHKIMTVPSFLYGEKIDISWPSTDSLAYFGIFTVTLNNSTIHFNKSNKGTGYGSSNFYIRVYGVIS